MMNEIRVMDKSFFFLSPAVRKRARLMEKKALNDDEEGFA